MNWKVGDKFWVDYTKCRLAPINDWKKWFPQSDAPFTVAHINNAGVVCDRGYNADMIAIYNKNKLVLDIINDL